MALVVEDGTGVAGANTFVTRDQTISYAEDRGVTLLDDTPTDVKILNAFTYLLTVDWRGYLLTPTQAAPWPRKAVYLDGSMPSPFALPYFDGTGYQLYPGYNPFFLLDPASAFPSDQIPLDVVNAQMELVLLQNAGFNILPVTGDQAFVTRETIGPITTEYSDKYGPVLGSPTMPTVDAILKRWICEQGGPFALKTRRV